MRALVTGGAGFVGTNLIKRLLSDNRWDDVVSLDNYSTGKKENEQDGCKYIEVDISDRLRRHKAFGLEIYQVEKPDVIFHLAAKARIVPSIQNPSKSLFNNIDSTINILEYARLNNVPVVYAGSSSSHGDIYANPYTFTKWNGEELCKLYHNVYDLPIAICRFYNVYGDHQLTEGAYCCVMGIFINQLRLGEPMTIRGDGEQRRDFTYVGDVVDANIKAATSDRVGGGEVINIGNGDNRSVNQIADLIGGNKINVSPVIEPRETLADNLKAKDLLDWLPKGNLEDWIPKWKTEIGIQES